ncbi:MAG TPA: DUF4142 domain-containing protein [Amycolatopsis sp.]|nr:DUF4142 domain-containing protein [Amycolatopsis sp.]
MLSVSDRRGPVRILLLIVVVVLSQLAAPAIARAQPVKLSDADRGLLVAVRQAGLWEMPVSGLAHIRGSNQHIRDIGKTLMVDHGRLDVLTRDLAKKYGVALPDQPNPDQQVWLKEVQNAAPGADFDRLFTNRLRLAHGIVFNSIAQVRVSTGNDEIRAYANTANQVVLRHIALLESTGLVDYGALPQPALGTANVLGMPASDLLTGLLVALGVVAVLFLGLWLTRSVRRRKHGTNQSGVDDVPGHISEKTAP